MMNQIALKAVFFDIDGTLIDSNDAHTHAWVQTLHRHGHAVSYNQIRRLIGKGSDKVFAEVLGIASDSALAKEITKDTPYDIAAAKAAGVKCIALRCGAYWDDADLSEAAAIFDDPAALLHHWASWPLTG